MLWSRSLFGYSITYAMEKEMTTKFTSFAVVTGVLIASATVFVGCSSEPTLAPPTNTSASTDWKNGLDAKVVTALSELPEADREAALKQKVCPVTDKQLGSMGKPPKVTVDGREVYLCCDGCESEIKSNPEQYLAKLNGEQ